MDDEDEEEEGSGNGSRTHKSKDLLWNILLPPPRLPFTFIFLSHYIITLFFLTFFRTFNTGNPTARGLSTLASLTAKMKYAYFSLLFFCFISVVSMTTFITIMCPVFLMSSSASTSHSSFVFHSFLTCCCILLHLHSPLPLSTRTKFSTSPREVQDCYLPKEETLLVLLHLQEVTRILWSRRS